MAKSRQTLDTLRCIWGASPVEWRLAVRYLNALFLFLVIVGGINWLLVGVAKIDLVAALTGATFGETNVVSSAIYILVGIAAIGLVPTLIRWVTSSDERVTA